jgi:hypothetical protein
LGRRRRLGGYHLAQLRVVGERRRKSGGTSKGEPSHV